MLLPFSWPVVAAADGASVATSDDAGTTLARRDYLSVATACIHQTAQLTSTGKEAAGCPDKVSE